MFHNKYVMFSAIALVWIMMVFHDPGCTHDFEASNGEGHILTRAINNAGNHVYPYLATVLTLTCLMIMVMAIICFGETLG